MIQHQNIAAYIQFLYQKRYQSAAPADLINRWQQVSEYQLQNELNHLYRHLNMSPDDAQELERQFLSTQPAQHFPPNQQGYQPQPNTGSQMGNTPPPQAYTTESRSSSNPWKVVSIVLIALVFLGGGAYFAMNLLNPSKSNQGSEFVQPNTAGTEQTQEQIKPESISESPQPKEPKIEEIPNIGNTPSEPTIDFSGTGLIMGLLRAETDQDMNLFMSYFADEVKYWDRGKLSKSQLRNLFAESWSKIDNARYSNIRVKEINPTNFELTADYTYYSYKDRHDKTYDIRDRYVFNKRGEIISTYSVKGKN